MSSTQRMLISLLWIWHRSCCLGWDRAGPKKSSSRTMGKDLNLLCMMIACVVCTIRWCVLLVLTAASVNGSSLTILSLSFTTSQMAPQALLAQRLCCSCKQAGFWIDKRLLWAVASSSYLNGTPVHTRKALVHGDLHAVGTPQLCCLLSLLAMLKVLARMGTLSAGLQPSKLR